MIATSFLIGSASNLQVIKTVIKSGASSISVQTGLFTSELLVLERWNIFSYLYGENIVRRIALSLLINSSSNLQVIRTAIKSRRRRVDSQLVPFYTIVHGYAAVPLPSYVIPLTRTSHPLAYRQFTLGLTTINTHFCLWQLFSGIISGSPLPPCETLIASNKLSVRCATSNHKQIITVILTFLLYRPNTLTLCTIIHFLLSVLIIACCGEAGT